MSSVIALNQIDGSELWKKVGFKHSEKVLVAPRGVYNLPFNLDDPVHTTYNESKLNINIEAQTKTKNMYTRKD